MKSIKILQLTLLVLLAAALAFIIVLRYQEGTDGTDAVSVIDAGAQDQNIAEPQEDEMDSYVQPSPTVSEEPYSDKPEVDITSWELKLVNAQNPLDASFSPELSDLGNGQGFDSRAEAYLELFLAAARNEELSAYIISSYRSYQSQDTLFKNKVAQYLSSEGSQEAAEKKAKTIVAYPGTSEHQLGLACDITDKYYQYMNESIADTELSKWMKEHCAEYGFILRYPEDKQDLTGVMYEPWHFRYVGIKAATYMMKNNLCLEEFVELYK